MTKTTHRIPHRLLIALLLLVGALIGSGSAQASPIVQCPGHPEGSYTTTVCAYVTNRALEFGTHPGVLTEGEIKRTGALAINGENYAESAAATLAYNASAWNFFASKGYADAGAHGYVTYTATNSALKDATVRVVAYHDDFMGENHDSRYSLTCNTVTYLVCTTPAVWMKNRDYSWYQPLRMVEGFASIETRPLVVKILNMTDQPLVRSTELALNNVRRDEQTADPETIPAGTDGRTRAGYYHFYRNPSANDTVSFNYAFADGTDATALTGQEIGIDISINKDGTTDQSSCTAPTGSSTNVECSMTVLGLADGILEAVVVVGV